MSLLTNQFQTLKLPSKFPGPFKGVRNDPPGASVT